MTVTFDGLLLEAEGSTILSIARSQMEYIL
jgi:hypothetical protein